MVKKLHFADDSNSELLTGIGYPPPFSTSTVWEKGQIFLILSEILRPEVSNCFFLGND